MGLIDREALIAAAKQRCVGCDNRKGTYCRACDIMDMLDLIEDQPEVEQPRWIPVTERLPQEYEPPGAFCRMLNLRHKDGYVTSGWLNRKSMRWFFIPLKKDYIVSEPHEFADITHWMPMKLRED